MFETTRRVLFDYSAAGVDDGLGAQAEDELVDAERDLKHMRIAFQDAADSAEAHDDGASEVLNEIVCSVCGFNHDRDSSAACEGCEGVRLADWIERVGQERLEAQSVVECRYTLAQVKAMGWMPPGLARANVQGFDEHETRADLEQARATRAEETLRQIYEAVVVGRQGEVAAREIVDNYFAAEAASTEPDA